MRYRKTLAKIRISLTLVFIILPLKIIYTFFNEMQLFHVDKNNIHYFFKSHSKVTSKVSPKCNLKCNFCFVRCTLGKITSL